MKIKHLFIGIALTANLFAATAQEVKKTYFVSKPGTLISMMTEEEANQVTHLTLTGKINAVDFRHLRDEFKNLQVLDIANASISMYSGKEGTYPDKFYIYMPNFVPAYAFCKMENGTAKGKSTLKKIILSEKIKNIEDAAFMGCENLNICQIKKKTPPNLLPEALADSITAIFVPLGASDEYRLKNRWDNFAFIEGEPLEAKIEVGALSTLENEIQKALRKLSKLYLYDCLRANKSLCAWGVEGRVPFLDKEFLDVAMRLNPVAKMCPGTIIEKKILREAFSDSLPKEIAWRQKEQFSDGVGYGWIDTLKKITSESVTDKEMANAAKRFPINPPQNKEEYYYRSIFEEHFPSESAARSVPSIPSVACSTAEALAWDSAFKNMNEPSGRAIKDVHESAY